MACYLLSLLFLLWEKTRKSNRKELKMFESTTFEEVSFSITEFEETTFSDESESVDNARIIDTGAERVTSDGSTRIYTD